MARDLYGELLGRALTRQAPPGHMPAYITPGEAQQLRAAGGGVTPGGGQVMAGGVPAFQPSRLSPRDMAGRQSTGYRASTWTKPSATFRGSNQPLGNLAPGMSIPRTDMFTRDPGVLEGFAAAQEARDRQAAIKARSVSPPPTTGGSNQPIIGYLPAAPAAASGIVWADPSVQPYTVDPTKPNAENQKLNLEAAVNNSKYYNHVEQRWTDAGVEHLAKNISEGGLGRWSPGATLLANNREAPAGAVAHVMQQSPRRGQGAAIFDPRGNVGVPPGYNMGWGPAALTTLGSLVAGGPVGAATTGMRWASGAPGIGRWIGDKWIEQKLPGSDLIGGLQDTLGLEGIRERLAAILSGGDTVAKFATQDYRQPWSGAAQLAYAMPDESDELLLEAEEAAAAEAEEPFTSEVPADLLARLDENAARGLLQLPQAGLA